MSSLWLALGISWTFSPQTYACSLSSKILLWKRRDILCLLRSKMTNYASWAKSGFLPIFGLWRKNRMLFCDMKIIWNSSFSGHKFCWDTNICYFGFCMLGLQSWVFETMYGPQKLNCTLAPYRKGIWPLTYINSRGYVKCAYCKI